MSKKHNVKKTRTHGAYGRRLEKRGLAGAPRQADFRLSDGRMSDAQR